MKFRYLKPEGKSKKHFLEAVAKARGCVTNQEIKEFLAKLPPINNHISMLPEYSKAAERLELAFSRHERIILFGDWDSDGVLALVQMYDLIRTAGHEELHWFIPDRRSDDYGLTLESVQKCYELFRPNLIITVDCGSPSHKSVEWLRGNQVDTIVIDHHQLGPNKEPLPAVAHLNPKACSFESPEIAELREMSASGLVFLFCDQFVKESQLKDWSRERSLILAGVGTVVDMMRLVGINRALVKWSIYLASKPDQLALVPGLVALNQVAGIKDISSSTYSFAWGPRLNAIGRLEEATAAVKLIMSHSVSEALQWAEHCNTANEERRRIQSSTVEAAIQQAESFINSPSEEDVRILVLFDQEWNPGVVGIVATRIKERYSRPAIVLGWHEDGFCKGSGRSLSPYDIGGAIHAAAQAGLIVSGGGHNMAAGLKTNLDQIEPLRNWLNKQCVLTNDDFAPNIEVLGRFDSLTPSEWCKVFEDLEPFGNGNPRPSLLLSKAKLVWGPNELLSRSGDVWALKAKFRTVSGDVIECIWTDIEVARKQWQQGKEYTAALNLTSSTKGSRTYYDWRISACEPL